MKFTVIGHVCKDVIHPAKGKERTGFGGILYATCALAAIASEKDQIFPVFGAGAEDEKDIRAILSRYPNVDLSGIYTFDGPTNTVHLFYKDTEERAECSSSISPPIPFTRIEPFLSTAGILINMISGSDINLDTLDNIRLAVRPKETPIHLDLHSLTLGVEPDGKRFRRALSDWRRWCFMIHSVQLNEEEAMGLTIEKFSDEMLAKQMLPLMVNTLCVTRGERGATVFQQEHKKLLRTNIDGLRITRSPETTGCGDVFGAALLFSHCSGKTAVDAAAFANQVASVNASLSGIEAIDALIKFRSGMML